MSFLDKIFRRNKKEEPEETVNELEKLKQEHKEELTKQKEHYEKELKQSNNKSHELINENKQLKEQLTINETKINELISQEVSKQLEKNTKESEAFPQCVEDNEAINEVSKKETQTKPETKKQLGKYGNHKIWDKLLIYTSWSSAYDKSIHIEGGKFKTHRSLSFGLSEVKNIAYKLDYYYEHNFTTDEIGKDNNLSTVATMRLLYNLKIGTFDKWLTEDCKEAIKHNNEAIHTKKIINSSKKHLREVPIQLQREYTITGLDSYNYFKFVKTTSSYTINDVIKIKEAIPNFKDYPTNESLIKLCHNGGRYVNERIIWNIEEGVFDKWISDYSQQLEIIENVDWKEYHPFFKSCNIDKQYQLFYEFKNWDDVGTNKYGNLPGNYAFNLLDILYIKNRLDDYVNANYNIINIAEDVCLSVAVVNKILFNLANGVFDKYLEKYVKHNDYEDDIIPPAYQSRINMRVHKLNGDEFRMEIVHWPENIVAHFPIRILGYVSSNKKGWYDNRVFAKDIISQLNEDGFGDVVSEVGSENMLRMIWTLYNRTSEYNELFKNIRDLSKIECKEDDFLHESHFFESKSGILYIDDVNTNLTIAKCNLILHEYINANNKEDCLNRMLKVYSMINEKHIKLICHYYDDSAFRKLLKSDNDKMVIVNDPHKRPASNTPVYV